VVKPPVEMEAYDYRDQIPYIGVAIKNQLKIEETNISR
jgi:hypothetical protein